MHVLFILQLTAGGQVYYPDADFHCWQADRAKAAHLTPWEIAHLINQCEVAAGDTFTVTPA